MTSFITEWVKVHSDKQWTMSGKILMLQAPFLLVHSFHIYLHVIAYMHLWQVKLEVHNVDDHRLAKELDTQKKLVSLVLQEINEANLACTM
jgi:hypothetical protein